MPHTTKEPSKEQCTLTTALPGLVQTGLVESSASMIQGLGMKAIMCTASQTVLIVCAPRNEVMLVRVSKLVRKLPI